MSHVGVIVEGPGDREAVPVIVRDYLAAQNEYSVGVGRPLSANGREKLLADGALERFVTLASRAPGACGVLVVFDSEGDDVCPLGPESLARAKGATRLPVRVCVANRQFENWIVASTETVFAESGLAALADPEGPGAVAHIKKGLKPKKYVKPVYQPKLAAKVDLELAATRCPSLRRLLRCIDELITECRSSV